MRKNESYKKYKKSLKNKKEKKRIGKVAEDSWKISEAFRKTMENL